LIGKAVYDILQKQKAASCKFFINTISQRRKPMFKSRKFMSAAVISFMTVIFMLNLMVSAEAETVPPFQKPPIALQASKILPKELLSGPNYQIDEKVRNDGLVNVYLLTTTDYGSMELKSTAELMIRINELQALKHMEELKKTRVFAKAFKKGVAAPLMTAKGVVTSPFKTVDGIVTGIGHWFTDIGRSVLKDDPHQEDPLKTAIGYATAKRAYAYEYGVDPYTSWKPIQDELETIAWTAFGGALTPKIAFRAIKKPAGAALRVSGTANSMRQLVRDKSPAELEKINDATLRKKDIPEYLRRSFLANPYYGPQEMTLLTGGLKSMGVCENLELFVGAAALVNGPATARFMRLRAQMMGDYYANVSTAKRVIEADGIPFLQRFDGTIVGLFPLDHVAWTAALSNKEKFVSDAIEQKTGVAGKEIWVTGTVDPAARKVLERRGWKVEENAWDKLKKKE
jgi:hypothetical protein